MAPYGRAASSGGSCSSGGRSSAPNLTKSPRSTSCGSASRGKRSSGSDRLLRSDMRRRVSPGDPSVGWSHAVLKSRPGSQGGQLNYRLAATEDHGAVRRAVLLRPRQGPGWRRDRSPIRRYTAPNGLFAFRRRGTGRRPGSYGRHHLDSFSEPYPCSCGDATSQGVARLCGSTLMMCLLE